MSNTVENQIAALWEELPAKWTHIAIDNDGTICAYTAAPIKTGGTWQPSEGTYRNLQNVVFDEVYTRPAAPMTADDLENWIKNRQTNQK